jgi:hypothetical protein
MVKGNVLGGGLWGEAGRRAQHAERAVIAHSSPEPAASLFGGGLVGRAGRRAPHAERAVMAHSSPEPAARWFGGGVLGEGLAGVLRTQREL